MIFRGHLAYEFYSSNTRNQYVAYSEVLIDNSWEESKKIELNHHCKLQSSLPTSSSPSPKLSCDWNTACSKKEKSTLDLSFRLINGKQKHSLHRKGVCETMSFILHHLRNNVSLPSFWITLQLVSSFLFWFEPCM